MPNNYASMKGIPFSMKDVKPIIAENLTALRKSRGLTQAELAEKFDYSDKAVSRWEHGDTLPDMNVLCELCEFYGITLDGLVSKNDEIENIQTAPKKGNDVKIAMCALTVSIVWLVATVIFVYSNIVNNSAYWKAFVWAVPVSCLVILRMTRTYRTKIFSIILSSLEIWTLLAAIYIQCLKYNIWLIFIIGVPAQIIIYLWHNIKTAR